MKSKISILTGILLVFVGLFIVLTWNFYTLHKEEAIQCDKQWKEQVPQNLSTEFGISMAISNSFLNSICFATEQDNLNEYFNMLFFTLAFIFLTIISWKFDNLKKK